MNTMHVTIGCLLQLFLCDACLVLWLCSVVRYNSTVISFIGRHLQIACFRIVLSCNEVTEMDPWTWFDCRWAIMSVCSHAALLSIILIFMPIMLNSYSIELFSPLILPWMISVALNLLITLETLFTLGVRPKTNCHYLLAIMSFQTSFDWLWLALCEEKTENEKG